MADELSMLADISIVIPPVGNSKAREVETRIMKIFEGYPQAITCIDISSDSKLLASESKDGTMHTWDLTPKSPSGWSIRKLVVKSDVANDKTIVAAFTFKLDDNKEPTNTIYEFDASTLDTVGARFEAHTKVVTALALSYHCALLASVSADLTINLL
ncbi:hypothetical protein K503DRAFT_860825 [Rhizopogon vinicolor AM-OR11-026]|uniref:Uncharacterized protein n=1 Tax=Rhizopogon vinicolor AM-OR11-026 TaxID=1314800 RepID=A0A1B7MF83_9AGAM|nr:hypothetical protein K503DRAFT_860825 [Rhizopogon vinicolor AM-OR11-026]